MNIADCYWTGAPGIFGSARAGLVGDPSTDAPFAAWKVSTGRTAALPWPQDPDSGQATTAALDAVLVSYGLPPTGLTAPTKLQLMAYAEDKLTALRAASRAYALGGGISVLCDAAAAPTGPDLISLLFWGNANPAATQPWVDNFGAVTTIAGTQAAVLANAVLAYGQSLFTVLAAAMTGIAGGSIVSTAEIDALTWPL